MNKLRKSMAIFAMFLLTALVFMPAISGMNVYQQPQSQIRPLDRGNDLADNIISYILGKSLKETVVVFSQLCERFESHCAEEIVMLATEAIAAGIHKNPLEYVTTMKEIAELEKEVGYELEGQVPDSNLQRYRDTVDILINLINKIIDNNIFSAFINKGVTRVAIIQLLVCRIVKQILMADG